MSYKAWEFQLKQVLVLYDSLNMIAYHWLIITIYEPAERKERDEQELVQARLGRVIEQTDGQTDPYSCKGVSAHQQRIPWVSSKFFRDGFGELRSSIFPTGDCGLPGFFAGQRRRNG